MTGHVPRVKARLELHAHRKVRGLLDGEYASVQTGRGMEFNDLRQYVRGDDVKGARGEPAGPAAAAPGAGAVLQLVSAGPPPG